MAGFGVGDWLRAERAAKVYGVDPNKLRAQPESTRNLLISAAEKKEADRKAKEQQDAEAKAAADKAAAEKASLDALGIKDPVIDQAKAQIDSELVPFPESTPSVLGEQSAAQKAALAGQRPQGAGGAPARRGPSLGGQFRQAAAGVNRQFADTKGLLESGAAQQKAGLEEQAGIAEQRGQEQANEYATYQAEMEQANADYMARREEHRQALKAAQEKFNTAASQQVDTQRFRKENTGKFLMAGLAMFFTDRAAIMAGGQAGQGMKWIEMVNRQVDQDIEEQRRQIESGKESASNEYKNLMAQWGDEEQVYNVMRAQRLQTLKTQLDAIGSEFQGPEQKAIAQQLAGKLDQETAQAMQNTLVRENQILSQQGAAMAKMMGGGAKKGKAIGSADVRSIAELKGAEGMISDLYRSFKNDTGAMSWLAKHLPGTDSSGYEAQRKIAAQVVGGILEGGKLTEDDYQRYLEMIPSSSTSDEEGARKLRELDRAINSKRQSALEGFRALGYDTGEMDTSGLQSIGAPVQ